MFVSSGGLSVGSTTHVQIEGNLFIDWAGNVQGQAAVENWASYGLPLDVHNNAFIGSGTTIEALRGYDSVVVHADANWYGTTDEQLVGSRILNNEDDLSRGVVTYLPILQSSDAVSPGSGWELGSYGNDTLGVDFSGAQHLFGFTGDDTYGVDNPSDVVTELAGQGFDTVYASVSFTLAANVEALFLVEGAGAIDGTGNVLGNALIGNSAANVLTGGAGDDVYGVDGNVDTVVEQANGGYDEVYSSESYSMPDNVETLFLAGNAVYGIGTSTNNAIIGNDRDNIISTGSGSFEILVGGAGNDLLIGGAGHDEMLGGPGNDTFRFEALSDAYNGVSNDGDLIYDFTRGEDHLQFNAAAFGFSFGIVDGVNFFSGTSPAAHAAISTLLYNNTSGLLFLDPDGTGTDSLSVIAAIGGAPHLAASDFNLY